MEFPHTYYLVSISRHMKRREALNTLKGTAAGLALSSMYDTSNSFDTEERILSDTMKHSVCKWCYGKIPLEEFADRCKDLGIHSIELLNPEDWDVVLRRGLTCALSNGSSLGIPKGFNNPIYHEQLNKELLEILPKAADNGIPQVIVFSGNRGNISDDEGLENCAQGLEKIVKRAEELNIQIVMELLNSKVDHADYMCDHTAWGRALVEKLGSSNFKLLYDIYHMQIMEGDIIRTIRDNADYIGHYHTGGVPGRNEIDETQELYYPAIIRAIQETGFEGFVAQEFIPSRGDDLKSLKQGVDICTL